MQFKVDTGPDTNLLPLDLYNKLLPSAKANHYKKTQVCIYLPIMDLKYITLAYVTSKCILKPTALRSSFMF